MSATESGPMIELERVCKKFGEATAVDDVSIEIARGEFFSMLGPSGCGKTTTLRMIAGFEEPTAGRVMLDCEDVTLVSPRHLERFPIREPVESVDGEPTPAGRPSRRSMSNSDFRAPTTWTGSLASIRA